MINKKISGALAIAILITIAFIVGVTIVISNNNSSLAIDTRQSTPKDSMEPQACTQEAKICLDGSVVKKTGSNYEFAECQVNAAFFENKLSNKEAQEIKKTFISYMKQFPVIYKFYENKPLSIRVDIKTETSLLGIITITNEENHSTPYFIATKIDDKWKVVAHGQDIPSCEIVDKYNIPTKLFWPNSNNACFETSGKFRKQ